MLVGGPGTASPTRVSPRAVGRTAGVVLVVALAVAAVRLPGPARLEVAEASSPEAAAAPAPATRSATPRELAVPPSPTPATPVDTAAAGAGTAGALSVPDEDGTPTSTPAASFDRPPITVATPVETPTGTTPAARFASQFPAHAAATQALEDPASTHWAVLVGVNDHEGATRDNIGSRQDAEALYTHLLDLGWQPDHVLLLTDRLATREAITEALAWLADRTTPDSTAVFHYAGHAKQWHGVDTDGDGEVTDEGLWPADNDHIVDSELVAMLDPVDAGRFWLTFMACEAGGFLDDGLVRDGRIVTYSATEVQKSYEDPSVGHSVWGWNLLANGMVAGLADADGDGDVTVQEAATWAIPRAATRTATQAYGPQDGGMVDRVGGPFSLAIDG